jgi:hypothetical protein
MKIVLEKSTDLVGWYRIVRETHDGRSWFKREGPNSLSFQMSERLSPEACIEGVAGEIREVATAILQKRSVSFKRCAVLRTDNGYLFSSPRNSQRAVLISHSDSEDFATKALLALDKDAEPIPDAPKLKYLVCPGPVTSKTDGQLHSITASELMALYEVDPRECYIMPLMVGWPVSVREQERQKIESMKLIRLAPRYDGKYVLPTWEEL